MKLQTLFHRFHVLYIDVSHKHLSLFTLRKSCSIQIFFRSIQENVAILKGRGGGELKNRLYW